MKKRFKLPRKKKKLHNKWRANPIFQNWLKQVRGFTFNPERQSDKEYIEMWSWRVHRAFAFKRGLTPSYETKGGYFESKWSENDPRNKENKCL